MTGSLCVYCRTDQLSQTGGRSVASAASSSIYETGSMAGTASLVTRRRHQVRTTIPTKAGLTTRTRLLMDNLTYTR